ncbi:MAG TPA: ethanolamine permease [Runella sp.]|nr:ethanolamine permease [Runella sp.]
MPIPKPTPQPTPTLHKVITTPQLWAIAVGLVISGVYFGWNYGWAVAGTLGFLLATLIVTVFYLTFIFSYTELTAAIPEAGGAFSYAFRAFGPVMGFVAGFATLVDFVMGPPAIAFALGGYAHFLHPDLSVMGVAVGTYVVFIAINLFGMRDSANFSLVITALSVVELLVFMGLVWPFYKTENFLAHNPPITAGGVFEALPFAIWFYVAIEGVAMVAEEVKDPKRTIAKGYILSILTLVILALGTMVLSGGATDWRTLIDMDYPLPETLSITLGRNNAWTKLFASLGLFGLLASFHCNTISYSRQIYALARERYLPQKLATLNQRFRTPHWALLAGGVVGLVALFVGETDEIIIFSVLGAMVMYLTSLLSLFRLRQTEPQLERPYRTPFYPWVPFLALGLAVLCLVAIVYYNLYLSLLFLGMLVVALGMFVWTRKRNN